MIHPPEREPKSDIQSEKGIFRETKEKKTNYCYFGNERLDWNSLRRTRGKEGERE